MSIRTTASERQLQIPKITNPHLGTWVAGVGAMTAHMSRCGNRFSADELTESGLQNPSKPRSWTVPSAKTQTAELTNKAGVIKFWRPFRAAGLWRMGVGSDYVSASVGASL